MDLFLDDEDIDPAKIWQQMSRTDLVLNTCDVTDHSVLHSSILRKNALKDGLISIVLKKHPTQKKPKDFQCSG
jgi:hypothetical protein